MSDDLDAMFDHEQPTPEELVEQSAPEVESKGEEPPVTPDAAPPAAQEERHQHVPITALLDERDKRKAAQHELEELRRWKAEQEARTHQPPPDFYENPEARLQMEREAIQRALVADRVERSRHLAVREHGQAFVEEVVNFFNDPKHAPKSHEFLGHPFPMEAAITYYRQQKALTEMGDDPAAYRERLREELRQELLQQAQPAPKPNIPPSMASAPSAGSTGNNSGSLFDQMIG